MKEILALDQRLTAQVGDSLPEEGIDFSRDGASEALETLPELLRAEIEALRQSLNGVVPEPFDYFVFLAGEEGPAFSLHLNQMPTGAPDGGFDPERSIIDQVRELDWEALRLRAEGQRGQMDQILQLLDQISRPLPSAKKWQRQFREEIKDFVREKRRDAGKIHVLMWDEAEGLMEGEHTDGDALRAALPGVIIQGGEVVAVVAGGKPLPVERIDALKAEAQRVVRERVREDMLAEDAPAGNASVREIEAEVVSGGGEEPPGREPSGQER